jgi:hypothetical protein
MLQCSRKLFKLMTGAINKQLRLAPAEQNIGRKKSTRKLPCRRYGTQVAYLRHANGS